MARKTKTGSSRRKGDEYQDLTALQLALELYIAGIDFELFIEYEKAGSFDDILVVSPGQVNGYQVKHAVSDHAVYDVNDLTNSRSVIFIEKFAKSWNLLKKRFPNHTLQLHLRSNRGLDSKLGGLVDANGFFDEKFRQGRYRKEKGDLRETLKDATSLSDEDFQGFVRDFHFDLNRPSWNNLEQHIQAVLLDHELGVSDRRIFADLKRLIEYHAIEVADPITSQLIDSFFRDIQTRYLLPQAFPVEKERFIEPSDLGKQLSDHLNDADGEYIVVTGPPGSGKSTALSEYFEALAEDESDKFVVVRYYCFVRVHDNRQRLRLEAKSLRVNLLTELQRSFPHVLDERRFDYSEDRFIEALERVGSDCLEQGKKLALFIDGLDHVERDAELHDSIIKALPNEVPPGILFVIGTQELHNWKPLALREGRENRHIQMPLFSQEETRIYIDRCGLAVSDSAIAQIHEKSCGLPLYLQYLAEIVATADEPNTAIKTIPAAANGDIRSYYEMLWAAFDAEEMGDAKYLSAILCSLRFSVHEDELFSFQMSLDPPRFDNAFRHVRHLLRVKDHLVTIFHNSFRVFVLAQISSDIKHEISSAIITRLKDEELKSARWFRHAFEYALDAHDYAYILDQVNRPFVDTALMRFRHKDEIMAAIDCAIEAAGRTSDLVALSRLGSLKYRTDERLEPDFPWQRQAEILLYEGRIDQVVDSLYSEESVGLLVDQEYSLQIILKLFDVGKIELAENLFMTLLKGLDEGNLSKQGVIDFARCAGIFPTRVSAVGHFIAERQLRQDILEPEDFTPVYMPHLASYIEGLVRAGRDRTWQLLKRVHKPLPNNLIRYLIIRAVAQYKSIGVLRSEIEQYVETHPNDTSVELGYLAVQARMPSCLVSRLAGRFDFPPEGATGETLGTDLANHIRRFAYWTVIFGYEQDDTIVRQLRSRIAGSATVWSRIQAHLLKVGDVVGCHFADRVIDWFAAAKQSIGALETACHVADEHTPDALDACRSILSQSLFWLSSVLVTRCPEHLDDWIKVLKRLRESFIWTTHYGFNESIVDYSFEFSVWERQTDLPQIRSRLRPVLDACAETYDEALQLKGSSRGAHFLTVAALAARCGFTTASQEWLKRGVESSLVYGYHKDTTLLNLSRVAAVLNKHQPDKTLNRCAAILEMAKWLPDVSDGKETKYIPQNIFPVVLNNSLSAALELLRGYYQHFAKWQADESLKKYILDRPNGDAEFLWALAALLKPNESGAVRQHIAEIGKTLAPQSNRIWNERLSRYMMTMINPRYWPDDLWGQMTQIHERPVRQYRNGGTSLNNLRDKTYQVDGRQITANELRERCRSSFAEMVTVIQTLKDQRAAYSDLLEASLPDHIANVKTVEELGSIKTFYEEHGQSEVVYLKQIGCKYLELGDVNSGLECLGYVIHEGISWGLSGYAIHKDAIRASIETFAKYDYERTRSIITSKLRENLQGPAYHGFNTPNTVAVVDDVLGKGGQVEQVFEDYLSHCQELFIQLPDEHKFDDLRGWNGTEKDENTQILHLLIDRLESPEFELGRRLIIAISELATSRGDTVVPILIERTMSSGGLQFWRLLIVFASFVPTTPHIFREHSHQLLPLLNCNNVFVRLLVSRLFQAGFEGESLPTEIAEAVRKVDSDYSSLIAYRGFSFLHIKPSHDFVDLTKKGAQFPFRQQLKAACDILDLNADSVTAHLERQLDVTIEEELDTARAMWRAFSHAQGWPVMWFVSDFHVRISNMLYQTLDEALIKQRYQSSDIEALWRVLQPGDPEYCTYRLRPIPGDILPLVIRDKDEWIADHYDTPCVTIEESIQEDWIVAFEFRQLAQDEPYHIPYITQTHVRSALVSPESINEVTEFRQQGWSEVVCTHHPSENLTWHQFRDALLYGHEYEQGGNGVCVPFVAYKESHPEFLGFHTIASFSSHVIREFALVFNGLDVFDGDDHVGHFEAWQEGYSDEDYNDQPLSFGVRFSVRSDFVRKVAHSSGRAFAVQTIENRFLMKDYQKKPDEQRSSTTVKLWPLLST